MKRTRKTALLISIILVLMPIRYEVQSEGYEPTAFSEVARLDLGGILLAAVWSPDGNKLMIGGENGLYLYDDSFELIEHLQIEADRSFVIDAAWSPDAKMLASIHGDGHVYLWDMEGVSIVTEWQPHVIKPTDISWSPDGLIIATSSWDGTVKLYDATSQQQLDVLVDNSLGSIDAISWSSNYEKLAFKTIVGSEGPSVVLWDVLTDQALGSRTSNRRVKLPYLSPDGSLLATGGPIFPDGDYPVQGILYIWETVPDLKPLRTIPLERYGAIEFYTLAWHPSGDLIAGYNSDKQIRIWDITTGDLVAKILGRERLPISDLPPYSSLAWHCDGTKLVDVGSDGIAVIWAIEVNEAYRTRC